jgi:hypothetical protein
MSNTETGPFVINILIPVGKCEWCFHNSGKRGEKMLKRAVLEGITLSTTDRQRTN